MQKGLLMGGMMVVLTIAAVLIFIKESPQFKKERLHDKAYIQENIDMINNIFNEDNEQKIETEVKKRLASELAKIKEESDDPQIIARQISTPKPKRHLDQKIDLPGDYPEHGSFADKKAWFDKNF